MRRRPRRQPGPSSTPSSCTACSPMSGQAAPQTYSQGMPPQGPLSKPNTSSPQSNNKAQPPDPTCSCRVIFPPLLPGLSLGHPCSLQVIVHGGSSGGAGSGPASTGGLSRLSHHLHCSPTAPKREYPPPPRNLQPHQPAQPQQAAQPQLQGPPHGGGQGPEPAGHEGLEIHGQAGWRDWRGRGSPAGPGRGPSQPQAPPPLCQITVRPVRRRLSSAASQKQTCVPGAKREEVEESEERRRRMRKMRRRRSRSPRLAARIQL